MSTATLAANFAGSEKNVRVGTGTTNTSKAPRRDFHGPGRGLVTRGRARARRPQPGGAWSRTEVGAGSCPPGTENLLHLPGLRLFRFLPPASCFPIASYREVESCGRRGQSLDRRRRGGVTRRTESQQVSGASQRARA